MVRIRTKLTTQSIAGFLVALVAAVALLGSVAPAQTIQGQTVYSSQAAPQAQALKSPEIILSELMSANQIPAEITPTLKVQQSDTLNAATDGKTLLITSALLNRLNTNGERAFVLSHELAHIVLQHINKTVVRRTGISIVDQLLVRRYAPEGSLLNMASQLGLNLYDKRASRGYEYQADDLGIKLMTRAGYNPQSAIDVFNILQAATPGGQVPEFLQDHPITNSRIQALVQKYKLSTSQ